MKHISPTAFNEVLQAEKSNSTVDFINVCTPAEYKEKHIEGVRSVPLDELSTHLNEFKDKKTIYIHCRSGARGRKAGELLLAQGVTAEIVNVEGGILAWEEAKFPVTLKKGAGLPLMRQVFLGAGLLILTSIFLTLFVSSYFIVMSTFIGLGLTISGATGWCGLAILLSKMPWNK